jgi:putative FmdB family regulatory protein
MPIYEYRCEHCGHTVEILQKVGARPRRKCEKCSGRLKKLISRTSFHLKGGGWYTEGYSKQAASKTAEAKPADKKPADKKPAGKSEKKTASA